MVVVRDVVGKRRSLRLRRGPGVERQILARVAFEDRCRHGAPGSRARSDKRAVVLDHALERLPGEIESVEFGVTMLEQGQDAQGLGVVIESAIRRHGGVERILAGVSERRVTKIVGKRQRLGEILVEPEHASDRAGDLRHLERMGEPRSVVVSLVVDEHLGLEFEAPKGGRMDDAVTIALKGGAGRARRLGVQASAALLWPAGIGCPAIGRRPTIVGKSLMGLGAHGRKLQATAWARNRRSGQPDAKGAAKRPRSGKSPALA